MLKSLRRKHIWIQTRFGFFSIVEKADDKQRGTLTIRARVKSDLEALRDKYLPDIDILEGGGTDYAYRATAPKDMVSAALGQIVGDIRYPNFKQAVAESQGYDRADAYNDVWTVLYGLQDRGRGNHGW